MQRAMLDQVQELKKESNEKNQLRDNEERELIQTQILNQAQKVENIQYHQFDIKKYRKEKIELINKEYKLRGEFSNLEKKYGKMKAEYEQTKLQNASLEENLKILDSELQMEAQKPEIVAKDKSTATKDDACKAQKESIIILNTQVYYGGGSISVLNMQAQSCSYDIQIYERNITVLNMQAQYTQTQSFGYDCKYCYEKKLIKTQILNQAQRVKNIQTNQFDIEKYTKEKMELINKEYELRMEFSSLEKKYSSMKAECEQKKLQNALLKKTLECKMQTLNSEVKMQVQKSKIVTKDKSTATEDKSTSTEDKSTVIEDKSTVIEDKSTVIEDKSIERNTIGSNAAALQAYEILYLQAHYDMQFYYGILQPGNIAVIYYGKPHYGKGNITTINMKADPVGCDCILPPTLEDDIDFF